MGTMDAVAPSFGKGGFHLFYVILIWYNPTLPGISSRKKKKDRYLGARRVMCCEHGFGQGKINSINTLALTFSTNAIRISLLQYSVNSQLYQLVIKF